MSINSAKALRLNIQISRSNNLLDDPVDCYYNQPMQYVWDEKKNAVNAAKHGVDFDLAKGFQWDTAVKFIDDRFEYGEIRHCAFGYIGVRLYCLIFTYRESEQVIRIISLRKANKREVLKYAET